MVRTNRLGLAAVSLLILLGASSAARADDLAERRVLAHTLTGVVPYSDQDVTRDITRGLVDGIREKLGDKLTPYAQGELRAAAEASAPSFPSFNRRIETRLAEGLSADELREAITFLTSPLAEKLRRNQAVLDAEQDSARKLALINKLFTPAELQQVTAMVSSPGTQKYMTLLANTGRELGEEMGKIYAANLDKRCAARTAPLPWCN